MATERDNEERQMGPPGPIGRDRAANDDRTGADEYADTVVDRVELASRAPLSAFRVGRADPFRGMAHERVSLIGPIGAMAPADGARSIRQPGRTLPGALPAKSNDPRTLRVPAPKPIVSDEPTAPGMIGEVGAQWIPSERTEIVRERKLHPDAVDPDTGRVLPTDHVPTAPGMAGISADPGERTAVVVRRNVVGQRIKRRR